MISNRRRLRSLRGAFLLSVGIGCGTNQRLEVDCHPVQGLSPEEGVAQLDRDGDGLLTAKDLQPGQVGTVLVWLGPSGPVGTSVHLSSESPMMTYGINDRWESMWGVDEFFRDCDPNLNVGVGFQQEDRDLIQLEVGAHEMGVSVHAQALEISGHAYMSDGVMRITQVHPKFSGHMEGSGTVHLESDLTGAPVGQAIRVVAFAFRDF